MPVTVMSAREIESLSSGELIDAMSLMPQFLQNSTPTNAYSFAHQLGASFLNLRGLGPNRTLVLLDGRRVVVLFAAAVLRISACSPRR